MNGAFEFEHGDPLGAYRSVHNSSTENGALEFGHEDPLGAYYSVHNSSTRYSALEFGHEDPLDFLSLSTNMWNSTSDSAPELGNLESVTNPPVAVHTNFDYDYGHDVLSIFPFNDYLHFEAEHIPIASVGVAAESYGRRLSSTATPDFLQTSQSSISSSLSELLHAQESSATTLPLRNLKSSRCLSPTPNAKLVLSPASSFQCSICQKNFAFELRLR